MIMSGEEREEGLRINRGRRRRRIKRIIRESRRILRRRIRIVRRRRTRRRQRRRRIRIMRRRRK